MGRCYDFPFPNILVLKKIVNIKLIRIKRYSVPGILKGWVDKIFAYYFSYGGNKNLKGKKW